MASRSLLDDVLTVKRIDWGLLDEADGGPRDTVAIETVSETVRRGRGILSEELSVLAVIASAAFTAAER